jgi:hypothetical protein
MYMTTIRPFPPHANRSPEGEKPEHFKKSPKGSVMAAFMSPTPNPTTVTCVKNETHVKRSVGIFQYKIFN